MPYPLVSDKVYDALGGINVKASDYMTGENQFLDIRNYCFERPNSLQSRPGLGANATVLSATVSVKPSSWFQWARQGGESYRLFQSGQTLYSLDPQLSSVGQSLYSSATQSPPLDYAVFDNLLYYANGFSFQRFDGTYSVQYQTPRQRNFVVGSFATFNAGAGGATTTLESGNYTFRIAYAKNYNTSFTSVGIIIQNDEVSINGEVVRNVSATLTNSGHWFLWGFTVPPGFGVSQIAVYMARPGSSLNFLGSPTLYNFHYTEFMGATQYGVTFPDFRSDTDWNNAPPFTLAPSFLEVYKNMLFTGGFSQYGSRIYFSNIASQENIPVENFIEVRSGNADTIKAMIVFQQNLVVFKSGSVHEVTGDSPDTLSVKDTNLEFGAVNNEAAVVFENKLWFIDKKGICEYNGPNTFIVSYPVEKYLQGLDLTKGRARHYKKMNQVWFSFSDKIFVYDYKVGGWFIYDIGSDTYGNSGGYLNDSNGLQDPLVLTSGSSHYAFSYISPSLTSDFGSAITLSLKTRFHKRMGDSTTEMWRRLFLDFASDLTLSCDVNFYSNYSESSSHSVSLAIEAYQERIDFGISAKSLSAEVVTSSAELVTFNGYTIESRYLRSV